MCFWLSLSIISATRRRSLRQKNAPNFLNRYIQGGSGGGRRGGGRRGQAPPAALSRGQYFKLIKEYKKNQPVYGHLNALQLSISLHQRCSVTFKMHQIHIRPGLRPIRTLGSSHTPSRLGPRARRGGRTNVCPGRHRPSSRHCRVAPEKVSR